MRRIELTVRHVVALLIAVAAVGVTSPARAIAQAPGSPSVASLDAAARRSVVDSVAAQVERIYVDADTAKLIANVVRRRLAAGAYDSATDPRRLAEQLTTDLRATNNDLHLGVTYSPVSAGRNNPALGFLGKSQHYALGRVDILPGNVGYMEVNGFSGESGARDMIVNALHYLETTDGMILDLRKNRGGDGSLVNFLISHFTGDDTLPSVTVRTRSDPRGFTRHTLAKVPGPRRPDVPLYVLISRNTGSAGEDCAFVLKNLRRATLVGGRTAGAGHNVTFVQSGFGFRTSISFSRVSDPRTGKEWEQVGVQPDVTVDPVAALDSAHVLALGSLAAKSDGEQRRQLEAQREIAMARAHPRAISASTLAGYTGIYEGNRRVTLAGGRLLYETVVGGMPEQLIALSDSEFMLGNQVRVAFERDAKGGMQIRARLPDGGITTFARVGAGNSPG